LKTRQCDSKICRHTAITYFCHLINYSYSINYTRQRDRWQQIIVFYFHREPGWHVSRGWLKSPPKNVNRIVADGRVFFFFQECRTLKDSCLYPFFVFSSLATISPSSCLLPFQSFNPLFLRPFFLFFGFPFWFPLRIFFTFPVFPLPFPCAYARGLALALLTRVWI